MRATVARGIVGKEMHAADDGVGLEHQIAARRRRDEGGIVGQAERARMGRERLEIARDQTIFGRHVGRRLGHRRHPAARSNSAARKLARQLVEHRIDHAGLVALDEGGGDVDIFRHHHARRHVAAMVELVGAGAQHRAQHRLDALERPALRQRLVDQRIELALLAHHAADDVAEERRLGRQILRALDLAAEPVALELGEDFVQAGAGEIHLVERLHRGEPRRAALVRLARVLVVELARCLAIICPRDCV